MFNLAATSAVGRDGGTGLHVQGHAGPRQGRIGTTPDLKVSGVGYNSTPLLLWTGSPWLSGAYGVPGTEPGSFAGAASALNRGAVFPGPAYLLF